MATYRRLTAVRLTEAAIALFVIFMMSNALIGPLLDPDQTGGDKIPLLRVVWLPVYAATASLALLRFPRLGRFWAPALALGLLIGWTFASTSWSLDPGVTLRRSIAVAATTLFGLYLAASYGGRALSELLAAAFLVLALGSYFVCLFVPTLGVHQDVNAGLWRGLWYEKNQLGAMMDYGALAALTAAITSPRRRILWLITLLLCMGLVAMSRSATSLVSLALILGGSFGLWLIGRGPVAALASAWAAGAGVAIAAGAYLFAPDLVFKALGKDPSLTGRTDIWEAVLGDFREQPLTGYGFAAFWDLDSAPAKWIRYRLEWIVPNAHNGWLDLLIQLGEVGVVLFATVLMAALVLALIRHRGLEDGGWSLLFLMVFTLTSFSESFILAHNSLPWVLAVAAISRVLGRSPHASARRDPGPPRQSCALMGDISPRPLELRRASRAHA